MLFVKLSIIVFVVLSIGRVLFPLSVFILEPAFGLVIIFVAVLVPIVVASVVVPGGQGRIVKIGFVVWKESFFKVCTVWERQGERRKFTKFCFRFVFVSRFSAFDPLSKKLWSFHPENLRKIYKNNQKLSARDWRVWLKVIWCWTKWRTNEDSIFFAPGSNQICYYSWKIVTRFKQYWIN